MKTLFETPKSPHWNFAAYHPLLRLLVLALIVGSVVFSPPALAKPDADADRANSPDWWKQAVIYEIYPRSFADSDNNGIGDLQGIVNHLPYLQTLGVDAIWITPIFPSPQADFGYDVANYEAVDPTYGTLADVDCLVAEGRQRGIKVLLDFVVNHSSESNAWFQASRSSRTNAFRDYYIWRDGKGPGQPPNNWHSLFGGPAWTFDPTTGQWYFHQFMAQEPDLNWRNPVVERNMFNVARWWCQRGIYGFRLDAVNALFEDPKLRDNPTLPGKDANGDQKQKPKYTVLMPEVHHELQKLRRVTDHFPGRILIAETWSGNSDELIAYYGPHNHEIQLPMYLSLTTLPLSSHELWAHIKAVEANRVAGWPCFALSNHDIRRAATRYTPPGMNTDDVAKLIGALLITIRGTPVLYYGEELGMVNNDPKRLEDVLDPMGRRLWPNDKGRDGERSPMQWDASTNAGFNTGAKPWLPVGPNYVTHNTVTESAEPDSVLNFYRALIRLRHENPAFSGDFEPVDEQDSHVFGYLRASPKGTALVLLNITAQPVQVGLTDANVQQVSSILLSHGAHLDQAIVRLDPFGVLIAAVEPATAK
ncbi:MAG: alpha-glucosidase [Verrucomicrobiota bacterium]|jgi:alpha-glucosidase